MGIIDVNKAIEAQRNYLKKLGEENNGDWMNESFKKGEGFAPSDGICFHCHHQIYDDVLIKRRDWKTGEFKDFVSKGISLEKAGSELTTGCPHCHYSFVE